MDKIKLFNLFVLTFLLSLSVQYLFFPSANQNKVQSTDVILEVKKVAVTIPNIPEVTLSNTTTGSFLLHPCEDISMSVDSTPLTGMSGAAPIFCNAIEITSGSKTLLPLKTLYKVFTNKSGNYVMIAKTPVGDRTVSFAVEEPGVFHSLLSHVVYEPIYNFFVALLTFLPGHSLG